MSAETDESRAETMMGRYTTIYRLLHTGAVEKASVKKDLRAEAADLEERLKACGYYAVPTVEFVLYNGPEPEGVVECGHGRDTVGAGATDTVGAGRGRVSGDDAPDSAELERVDTEGAGEAGHRVEDPAVSRVARRVQVSEPSYPEGPAESGDMVPFDI